MCEAVTTSTAFISVRCETANYLLIPVLQFSDQVVKVITSTYTRPEVKNTYQTGGLTTNAVDHLSLFN